MKTTTSSEPVRSTTSKLLEKFGIQSEDPKKEKFNYLMKKYHEQLDDEKILRISFAKNFVLEDMEKCLKEYLEYKEKYNLGKLFLKLHSFEQQIEKLKNQNLKEPSPTNLDHLEEVIQKKTETLSPYLPLIKRQVFTFLPGCHDKKGRGVMVIKPANWSPGSLSFSTLLEGFDCFTEKFIHDRYPSNITNGQIWIIDMKNVGIRNFDIMGQREFSKVVQDKIPLNVGKILILNCPKILEIVLSTLKNFYREPLRQKIEILSNNSDLARFFDKDQIPSQYGGNVLFDYYQWVKDTFGLSISPSETEEEILKKEETKITQEEIDKWMNEWEQIIGP